MKKSKTAERCGREPKKRCGCNHWRELSDELVCLPCAPCAIDRKGKAIGRVAKLGKCSAAAVKAVLGGHVSGKATLCTDGDASYHKFSKDNGNGLVQIQGGKGTVKEIYHIQPPQRLPLQAESLPHLVQGRVHQIPQQLPDLEQRNASLSPMNLAQKTKPPRKSDGSFMLRLETTVMAIKVIVLSANSSD